MDTMKNIEGLKNSLRSLPGLGTTDGEDKPKAISVMLTNMWHYEIYEADMQDNGDWLMFGKVDGFESELGYFSLSEIEPHLWLWMPLWGWDEMEATA